MEFRIDKKTFLKALTMLQTIVERRSTIPILSNALIQTNEDVIILTATDLETAIQGHFPASISLQGDVCVSARKLFEIVRELPDSEIRLTKKENNWVSLTCEKSVFNVAGMSSEEFPPLPRFSDADFRSFPADEITHMIEATVFAASTEESRYNLNGVFFKAIEIDNQPGIRMVATDGHRLALIDRSGLDFSHLEKGVIIPRKGLLEIRKLVAETKPKDDTQDDRIHLSLSENNFIAKRHDIIVVTRLIEGEFPDYDSVIPKENDKKVLLSKERFAQCLKRVSTMASERGEGLVFQIQRGSMAVSSSTHDYGDAKEDIDIDYGGDDLVVGFNARYLLDALSVIDEDDLLLELKDSATAGILRPTEGQGHLCLIMPMKL
jgi:DNA polymerase-3 subunit beta